MNAPNVCNAWQKIIETPLKIEQECHDGPE